MRIRLLTRLLLWLLYRLLPLIQRLVVPSPYVKNILCHVLGLFSCLRDVVSLSVPVVLRLLLVLLLWLLIVTLLLLTVLLLLHSVVYRLHELIEPLDRPHCGVEECVQVLHVVINLGVLCSHQRLLKVINRLFEFLVVLFLQLGNLRHALLDVVNLQ